ncbi:MAG: IS3 family transposase, partial [Thermoanaerobaculia bacterium]
MPPGPEVLEKAQRRQYSAEYKLRVLQDADSLKDSGAIGGLLRREGLYSSHLVTWRRQREEGFLSALSPKRRGRRARERNPLARRVAELEGENRDLKKRIKEAETIIEVQKKPLGALGTEPTGSREHRELVMTAVEEIQNLVGTARACDVLDVARASYYRWRDPQVEPPSPRLSPPRTLSSPERRVVLETLNSQEFSDKAPAEVFATLLDRREYLCSIRTMYRILAENGEVRERRDQLRHPVYRKPELLATGPNQVWSWDITKLLGPVKWTYYYLYVILDIFSRYPVGWMVAGQENAALAERLIDETQKKEGIQPEQLTIHMDRGGPMTAKSFALLLADLGITKSHSRPHVSDDNPFIESHFKTIKYMPDFPDNFGSLQDARAYCRGFFQWYAMEHHHSGIALLTPYQVHRGLSELVTRQRQEVLTQAYAQHPERFVRQPP